MESVVLAFVVWAGVVAAQTGANAAVEGVEGVDVGAPPREVARLKAPLRLSQTAHRLPPQKPSQLSPQFHPQTDLLQRKNPLRTLDLPLS